MSGVSRLLSYPADGREERTHDQLVVAIAYRNPRQIADDGAAY